LKKYLFAVWRIITKFVGQRVTNAYSKLRDMFKGQPKGLFALALANTGERFGYYTMLAIFMLFLQAKFGWNGATASQVYAILPRRGCTSCPWWAAGWPTRSDTENAS
jgi:hypothetical protein